MNRRSLLLGGAALAAASLALPAVASRSSAAGGWVPPESLLERLPLLMRVGGIPGVGIAVASGGRLVWNRSFGVRNVVTAEPVDDSSLFEAASMTKPVFAWLAMKLVDEGKLELDRPLMHYSRPPYLGKDPALSAITVRDVLRHSSGLPNWAEGPLVTIAPPGKSYTYSGEGYVWLQLIVEALTGQGLGALAEQRLFRPAGMSRSTFGWTKQIARAAVYGHELTPNGDAKLAPQPTRALGNALLPVAERWNKPIASWTYQDQVRAMREAVPATPPVPHELLVNAAGGLLTTPSDYVSFMLLMMDGRRRADWQISDGSRRAMLSRQLDVRGPDFFRSLGWQGERHSTGALFEHSGSNYDIFHSLAVGDPRTGDAIAIFTNGKNGSALAQRIVRQAAGLELLKFLV